MADPTTPTTTAPFDFNSPPGQDAGGGSGSGTIKAKAGAVPIGVPFIIDGYDATGKPVGHYYTPTVSTNEVDTTYRGPGGPEARQITGTMPQQPRYFTGDEYAPATWSPDRISAYQQLMVKAGMLNAGKYTPGVWDPASVGAYTTLLGEANQSGMSAEDVLAKNTAGAPLAAQAAANALPVQVTNSADLETVFRKAIIDTLGQGWSQDKINGMVAAYQAVETQAQQQNNALRAAGQGGTIQQPPSAQAYAEQQARQENPTGVQEHDIIKPGGPLDAFKQIIGGWQ